MTSCIFGACVATINLVSGGSYVEKTPSAVVDLANRTHNISHFYEIQNHQFNLNGYLILDTETRIDLGYDNGLKSQKRTRSKALSIGMTQLSHLDDSVFLTYGLSTKLGGKVTNIPCTDEGSVKRFFYCDNLATLEPFEQAKHITPYKATINYIHKF